MALFIGGAFAVLGIIQLRQSRLRACRYFELAVLVDLLLGQPFTLLDAGFAGHFEVLWSGLLAFFVLRYGLKRPDLSRQVVIFVVGKDVALLALACSTSSARTPGVRTRRSSPGSSATC